MSGWQIAVLAAEILYLLIGILMIRPTMVREMKCGYKFSREDFNFYIPFLIIVAWPILALMRPLRNYMDSDSKRYQDYLKRAGLDL